MNQNIELVYKIWDAPDKFINTSEDLDKYLLIENEEPRILSYLARFEGSNEVELKLKAIIRKVSYYIANYKEIKDDLIYGRKVTIKENKYKEEDELKAKEDVLSQMSKLSLELTEIESRRNVVDYVKSDYCSPLNYTIQGNRRVLSLTNPNDFLMLYTGIPFDQQQRDLYSHWKNLQEPTSIAFEALILSSEGTNIIKKDLGRRPQIWFPASVLELKEGMNSIGDFEIEITRMELKTKNLFLYTGIKVDTVGEELRIIGVSSE